VLRLIFGPRSNKRTEELPNKKILKLYFTPNKPRTMRWVGHVEHIGEMREAHTKSEGTRPLVRVRLRYAIKTGLK
jgi:hypothetical protein